jgi:hypothetical protein
MPPSLSAFGAKRTSRHLGWRIARAPLTQLGRRAASFAVLHNGPSRYGRVRLSANREGLGETARHSRPETRENATPQAYEAEAQQRGNDREPTQLGCQRSARTA